MVRREMECRECGKTLDIMEEEAGICYTCQQEGHKYFEGRCDECGCETIVTESFVTGLLYCEDCLENSEAQAIRDTMED
jgi:hypothetical protein